MIRLNTLLFYAISIRNFKFNFQKVLIFTILFLLFLLLFYYFIKQRRYKLLDEKIVFGFRKKEILYRNINSLFFTLTYRPKGIYDIGLGEPYLYVKEHGTKNIYAILQFVWSILILCKKVMKAI